MKKMYTLLMFTLIKYYPISRLMQIEKPAASSRLVSSLLFSGPRNCTLEATRIVRPVND